MSRREELLKKNANIRSTADISDAEVRAATTSHKPRSGQGSFEQRQRLEDRIKDLESRVGEPEGRELLLGTISPNPWQPRRVFDDTDLIKLGASIEAVGLLQPIIVRTVSNRDTSGQKQEAHQSFQIIAGERRFRAHQIIGKKSIKALVLDVSDEDMARFALAENVNRTDLTAFEIAVAIRNAEAIFSSKTSLAAALGLNRTALYKYLSFFKLPAFMIADLEVKPALLGRDAADAIASALAANGNEAVDCLKDIWPRVKAGALDQGKMVNTLEAALRHRTPIRTERQIRKLFIGKEQAGSITRDGAALTVKIRAAALTPEKEAELVAVVQGMFP